MFDKPEKKGEKPQEERPIIVMKDRNTKYITADEVPRKGDEEYAASRMIQHLKKLLGKTRLILKTDQEPAIVTLRERIRNEVLTSSHPARAIVNIKY